MPGTKLSQLERKLEKQWELGNYPYPTLRSVGIRSSGDHAGGLRGIKRVDLVLNYPITVISGRNGSGKSTLLALSCLGFHGLPEYLPPGRARHYYTFKDFFFRGPRDPDVSGVSIGWTYSGEFPTLLIRKQSSKWMHYERRPQRPVLHIGASRILPAVDQPVLRSHFRGGERTLRGQRALTSAALKHVSYIMGKSYDSAETITATRYSLRSCSAGARYSSFNMGSGEDVVIELIAAIESAPEGSLITIEEVELGIHPQALQKLAEVLEILAFERRLQIVCTSHSDWFIDALPRRARVLIERLGENHLVTIAPTTRYAISQMAGQPSEELVAYCEDEVAGRLIQRALTDEQRRRVKIVPVGAKSQLLSAANFHRLAEHGALHLVIWDGDVGDSEILKWHRSLGLKDAETAALSWTRLAGAGIAPEQAILESVTMSSSTLNAAATSLGVDKDRLQAVIIQCLTTLDTHDAFFEVARSLGFGTKETVLEACIAAHVESPAGQSEELRAIVQEVLNGRPTRVPDPLRPMEAPCLDA